MPEVRVEYFNACGRAEIIRWILKAAVVEFEDYRYAKPGGPDASKTWPANKPNTPFGQCPVVKLDGKAYSQSMAIARYFANKHGFGGETDEEKAMCDQIVDCVVDMNMPKVVAWKEEDATKKAELVKKWEEEHVPKFLAYFDRMLKANPKKSAFFVGDKMTWADMYFALNCTLTGVDLINATIDWTNFPELKALTDKVIALPAIAAWIKERPQTRF